MIKINLLSGGERPKRSRRKAVKLPSGMVGVAAAGLLLVGGMIAVWLLMAGRIHLLESKKVTRTQELAVLKEKVKEVENYEANKKSYEQKIAIIEELRREQSGPVRLLDDLSRNIPGRVWLTLVSESTGMISIEGRSVTNAEIVDFINNLKSSPRIKDIVLIESRQVKEESVPVFNFKLQFRFLSESAA